MRLTSDLRTLRAWLRDATQRLEQADVASPRHDAERLAALALGLRWSDLWSSRDIAPSELDRLERLIARRTSGEPLAYIEGHATFYGLELTCGPGVLVPRPETEVLVDVSLRLLDGIDRPVVLDIGCGTGAIALAIASHVPGAEVIATDVSASALVYAKRNAAALGIDVWIAEGDLFDSVPQMLRGRVDLVVSNPPYVPDDAQLPPDVRAEPPIALFGGDKGTDVLRRIVASAPRWLRRGGAVALEIGDESQTRVLPGATTVNDLTGKPRVVWKRY